MNWNAYPHRELAETVLTPNQLLIFRLRLGGMSLREISLHMDVSVSTVRSVFARAEQKIGIALEKENAA